MKRASPKRKSPKRKSPCKKGEILKKGYVREGYFKQSGVYVPSTYVESACIKDIGEPGKGKSLFPLEEPKNFGKYGYHYAEKSKTKRQAILKKALKEVDHLALLRYLNALRILNKPRPELYINLDEDFKYIQDLYNKNK